MNRTQKWTIAGITCAVDAVAYGVMFALPKLIAHYEEMGVEEFPTIR
jgi:hypothetical protein